MSDGVVYFDPYAQGNAQAAGSSLNPNEVVYQDPYAQRPAAGLAQDAAETPDIIEARLHAPDIDDLLDDQSARALYLKNKQSSLEEKAREFGKGAWEGFKGIAADVAGAVGELAQPSNWGRVPGTLAHGAIQGTAQTADLARMLGRAAFDAVRDLGGSEEEKIQHFKERYNANLISQRALARGNNQDHTLVQLPDIAGKPLPHTLATSSLLLDPITLATMGTGGAVEAGAKGMLGRALSKVPGAAKAAEALEAARAIPGQAGVQALKGVEEAGRKVAELARKPAEALAEKVGEIVPPGAAHMAEGIAHLAGPGSIVAAATGHAGPVTGTLAALKGTELAAEGTSQIAQAVRHLAETRGPSAVGRLVQLAHNPEAPTWIQTLAKGLRAVGADKVAQMGADYAGAAVHGGAMGTAMGLLGGESPEEAGQMVGGGVGMGMLGRTVGKATGLDAKARRMLEDAGDYARFYAHLKAQGVPDEVIERIQTGQAAVLSRLGASQAKAIFGKNLDFRYLTSDAYEKAVPAQGKGTSAFFDRFQDEPGKTPTITVNVEKLGDKTYHELFHAIANAVGADAEMRLKIDSVLTPEELKVEGLRYAGKLVAGRLRAEGKEPLHVPDWDGLVKAAVQELNDRHNGDQWIYDEIYADAGGHYLTGKDMVRDIADPSARTLLRQAGREVMDKIWDVVRGPQEESLPRHAVFENPKIYNSPVLEGMFRDHVRRLYRDGVGKAGTGRETREGTPPPVEVPGRLIDKHPAMPGKMLAENGVVVPQSDGTFKPAPPAVFRNAEKAKAEAIHDALVKQPTKPKGDKSPEVAPRVNNQGEKEVSGSKLADKLATLPIIGDWAKEAAKKIEALMGSGNAFEAWYHAIGRGYPWGRSVTKNKGNIPVSRIALAPFLWKVSKENNVLAVGLSITAAERKIAKWKLEGKLDTLWGGDAAGFRADLMTYLKNHAEGRPGSAGIGEHKRNALNVFVAGKEVKLADYNPLRAAVTGEDKNGIVRSLRLDRIATVEPSQHTGWHAEWEKKRINAAPDTAKRAQDEGV